MKFIKFRKKKKQYFLLGLIFTIAVTLFSVCTIFTLVANTFATQYYKGDRTPDLTYVTISESCFNKSVDWCTLQGEKVRNLSKREILAVSNNIRVNNKLLDLSFSYVIPIKNVKELNWKVNVISGDTKSLAPKKNEIWVPKTFADTKGIKLGDEIVIKNSKDENVPLKVTTLITDSNQPSTTMGITYFYINSDKMSSLSGVTKAYLTTFNAEDGGAKSTANIIKYINEPLAGLMFNKEFFKMAATTIPIMVGGIGLVAGMLLIGVLIIILRANLSSNILKEYKSIGIYKSIGMSSRKIGRLYLATYEAVSIVSSLIGILLSVPISNYICNIIFEYIGKYSFDLTSLIIIVMIFSIFNLLVYINLKLILRRIDKIKPVEAINIGVTSSKEKFKKSLIKNNSSSFAMAINDIFKYKKINFIILIIFALCFYISILFVNMQNSMVTIEKNCHTWFGNPKSDMVITSDINKENPLREVTKYVDKMKYAQKNYLWDVYSGSRKVSIDSKKYKVNLQVFFINVYNEYKEEDYSITKGRNPREINEISLSGKVMKDNNLAIGDYMEFFVEGEHREFLITGTYNSMMADNQSIRVLTRAVNGHGGNVAFIKLNNKDNFEAIKKDLEEKFDYITVERVYPLLKDSVVQIKSITGTVTIIILVGIVAFSIVNVISAVMSINADNRKNYGIMKSQGFSSSYIRNRCLYRIMILSTIGAAIGLVINLLSSRTLMKTMLRGTDGYVFTLLGTVLIVTILLAVTAISTVLCCRSIKNISTVELIVD
ncbi:MAG: FtsX-like permease family protein [Clostridium sp.]|uniref:ABC transporter permease n=1 Tax=Clostridium sp. TaxID=1506 RepID=UPI003D6D76AC